MSNHISPMHNLSKSNIGPQIPLNNDLKKSSPIVDEKIKVFHNALCDNCKEKILDVRFKCGNCADYDLCQACELKRPHEKTHIFLKIYEPVSAPTGTLLPLMYANTNSNANKQTETRSKLKSALVARFVKDVSIQDGTILSPGQKFTKIWKIRNDGETEWPTGTRLVMTDGIQMGNISVEVSNAAPGEELDIPVELIAPNQEGRYTSYWRLVGTNGLRFGHRIWLDIKVSNNQENLNPITNNKNEESELFQKIKEETKKEEIMIEQVIENQKQKLQEQLQRTSDFIRKNKENAEEIMIEQANAIEDQKQKLQEQLQRTSDFIRKNKENAEEERLLEETKARELEIQIFLKAEQEKSSTRKRSSAPN